MTQTQTVEREEAAPEKTAAHLSIETIRKWGACSDGRDWFRGKFPHGGDYCDVMLALYADGRKDDANWLASTMLSNKPTEAFIKSDVKSIIDLAQDAATTGDWAHAATTGDWAHAATTGDWARAATTGNWAHAATTGNWAHAATTGDWARAATTGNWAHAATTGDWAHSATTGENCIVSALGINSHIKLGPNGCGDLHWHDGKRFRTVTIYAGEGGIEADTWYRLDESGRAIVAGEE